MDTDDCTGEESKAYIDKTMFQNHWLYDYITPIYNKRNLEDVLKKSEIPYLRKNKKEYVRIFPTNRRGGDIKEIEEFSRKLRLASDISNMYLFIDRCLEVQKNYPTFSAL